MRIDTYENFQAAPTVGPAVRYDAPRGPSAGDVRAQQLGDLGQAVQRGADSQSRVAAAMAEDANQVRVNDAVNQYVRAQTDARVEAMQLKGRNALERPDGKSLPDEYGERMRTQAETLAQGLGNDAQRKMFGQASAKMDAQFHGALSEHMVGQMAVYRKETQKATIETAASQGALLWSDPAALAQSSATIGRVVDAIATDMGMSPEARAAALAESISPMHVGVMKSMIQAGMAGAAVNYYNEHSAGMTIQARAQMQGVVKQANDTQTGETHADTVWGMYGPKGANDPVKLFDLERDLRANLKDNPDAMKHGIAALRERASAFNAQQAEVNAAGVNRVFGMIDQGTSLSTIRRSPEWLDLPEIKRHEITRSLESEAATRESRAAAREGRAAAAEQRGLAADQRRDRQLLLGNGDAYLRMTDPSELSKMTREQVAASRTQFGFEGAQHLLQRFDALQKPGAIAEARMEQDTFNQLAERMGLHPYKAKTEEQKAELGAVKFRVEQLIDTAQRGKKAALTYAEKYELMRGEMARTVTVNPGWYAPRRTVPVVQLMPGDVAKVDVPADARRDIAARLQKRYAADPSNPRFAPTEENVRYWFLRDTSRAADLIAAGQ